MVDYEQEFVQLTNKAFGVSVRPGEDFFPSLALPADLRGICMEAYMRCDWRTACLCDEISKCYETIWDNNGANYRLKNKNRFDSLCEILSRTRDHAAKIWMGK
jgi:hypothetical protein